MRSAVVYVSSICPECKSISTMPYTRLEIAELLLSDKPFTLYSACHNISWVATEGDRRRMFGLIRPADVILPVPGTALEPQGSPEFGDFKSSHVEAIARTDAPPS